MDRFFEVDGAGLAYYQNLTHSYNLILCVLSHLLSTFLVQCEQFVPKEAMSNLVEISCSSTQLPRPRGKPPQTNPLSSVLY